MQISIVFRDRRLPTTIAYQKVKQRLTFFRTNLRTIHRKKDQGHPKDIMYGELTTGTRPTGRPTLRYKDVCKRDLKTCSISPGNLESATADRTLWRSTVKAGVKQAELKRESQWEVKRTRRQQRLQSAPIPPTPTNDFTCAKCQRVCGSRIGLHSHSRRCSLT